MFAVETVSAYKKLSQKLYHRVSEIKELYRKNPKITDRKASIMEISFLMVTQGNTRLYVVENGKYYGTIFRSDIIKKVLHI